MSNNQVNAGSFGGGGGSGSGGSGGSNGGSHNPGSRPGSNGNGSNSSSGHHQHLQQPLLQAQSSIPQIIDGGSGSAVIAASTSTAASQADSSNNMIIDSSPRESGDDSEDESEILEESPCGRWLKRREEVDQRDVPGIDCVHLAMDTEEGVEVVWNEVQYASLQELKTQEDKMRQVFDNLLQLDHPNIVKFHRYWTDTVNIERPRVIFITEYMSSGSLKKFLQRTKRNSKRLPLEAWKRWCTQILSALSYLHSCTPPVIHGNLTCDSILIQHNGLVKIGSVVPDAVHYNVSQHLAEMAEQGSRHFMAPEYSASANEQQLTAAVDIYAFGMCALEMAALEIQPSNSSDTNSIGDETILRTINSLEHDLQRDLIFKCLRNNPACRPSANDLLFHPLLFEVHSLKLLSAHCLVSSPLSRTTYTDTVLDALMQRYNHRDVILATVRANGEEKHYKLSNVKAADKLEKFVEDVKYGVYPITAFSRKKPPHFRSRAASPERKDSTKSATPEPVDIESRRIINMMCSVKKLKEESNDISMTILLRMDDKMNRQLTCQVTEEDSAIDLTNELVRLGFVHVADQEKIQALLEETLYGSFVQDGGIAPLEYGDQPLTFSATFNESNQQQVSDQAQAQALHPQQGQSQQQQLQQQSQYQQASENQQQQQQTYEQQQQQQTFEQQQVFKKKIELQQQQQQQQHQIHQMDQQIENQQQHQHQHPQQHHHLGQQQQLAQHFEQQQHQHQQQQLEHLQQQQHQQHIQHMQHRPSLQQQQHMSFDQQQMHTQLASHHLEQQHQISAQQPQNPQQHLPPQQIQMPPSQPNQLPSQTQHIDPQQQHVHREQQQQQQISSHSHLEQAQQIASHQMPQQQHHPHLEQLNAHPQQAQQMATHQQILSHPQQSQQQMPTKANSHTNGNGTNYYGSFTPVSAQSHSTGPLDESVFISNPNVPGTSSLGGPASIASSIPVSLQATMQQQAVATSSAGAVIDSNSRHIPIPTNNLATTTATNMSTYNQYDGNWCVSDAEHHNYYQTPHMPQITTSAPGYVLTSSELQGSASSSATSTITTAPMSLGPSTTVMYIPQESLTLPQATVTTAPLQHHHPQQHHQQHQNHPQRQPHSVPQTAHIIVPAPTHHSQHPQGYHIQPQIFEAGAISSSNIVLNNGASIALSSAPIPVGTNVSSITSTNPAASTTIN